MTKFVCPNPFLFYKINSLLPAVLSRKPVPADHSAEEQSAEEQSS
jgi:hypothetical protein